MIEMTRWACVSLVLALTICIGNGAHWRDDLDQSWFAGLQTPDIPPAYLATPRIAAMRKEAIRQTSSPIKLSIEDCFLPQSGIEPTPALQRDRSVLIDLFYATGGPKWNSLSRANWLNNSVSVCCWSLVSCNFQPGLASSSSVSLPYPSHPLSLGYVFGFGYDGSNDAPSYFIDQMAGSLPDTIGNFSNIVNFLIAYQRSLTGVIPTSIGRLTNLIALSITETSVTGSITADHIKNLRRLNFLFLGVNRLSGEFPDALPPSIQQVALNVFLFIYFFIYLLIYLLMF